MTYSEPLGFDGPTSDPDWLYYAPLTLQIWTGFTNLQQGLALGAHNVSPIALWTQVMSLIHATDLLRSYLPDSSNDESEPTITATNSQGYLLIAERALEALQEKLAIEEKPAPLELWSAWKCLRHSLAALAQTLKLQALGE